MSNKHAQHLSDLRRKSDVALGIFVKAEKQLQKHNAELAETIQAIDTEIAELQSLKSAATQHHSDNQTVLGNINTLLRGEGGTN